MSEKFTAAGTHLRNCPVCLRTGTLTGARANDATLECSECAAKFTYHAHDPSGPTLTRLRTPNPSDLCGCGAFTGGGQCTSCREGYQREQREYRRGP